MGRYADVGIRTTSCATCWPSCPRRAPTIERVKQAYWAALDEASSAADAERRLRGLVGELERQYPSAAACLAEDLPALCVHLRYPSRLRVRLRSTNLLERPLGEVKRRTRVIGRFPGETSCLSLCWAVLDLVIAGARGLGLTDLDQRGIEHMRLERVRQTPVERTASCAENREGYPSAFTSPVGRDPSCAPPPRTPSDGRR